MATWAKSSQYRDMPHQQYMQTEEGQKSGQFFRQDAQRMREGRNTPQGTGFATGRAESQQSPYSGSTPYQKNPAGDFAAYSPQQNTQQFGNTTLNQSYSPGSSPYGQAPQASPTDGNWANYATQNRPAPFTARYGQPDGSFSDSPNYNQRDAFIQALNNQQTPYMTGQARGMPQFDIGSAWNQASQMVQQGFQNPFAPNLAAQPQQPPLPNLAAQAFPSQYQPMAPQQSPQQGGLAGIQRRLSNATTQEQLLEINRDGRALMQQQSAAPGNRPPTRPPQGYGTPQRRASSAVANAGGAAAQASAMAVLARARPDQRAQLEEVLRQKGALAAPSEDRYQGADFSNYISERKSPGDQADFARWANSMPGGGGSNSAALAQQWNKWTPAQRQFQMMKIDQSTPNADRAWAGVGDKGVYGKDIDGTTLMVDRSGVLTRQKDPVRPSTMTQESWSKKRNAEYAQQVGKYVLGGHEVPDWLVEQGQREGLTFANPNAWKSDGWVTENGGIRPAREGEQGMNIYGEKSRHGTSPFGRYMWEGVSTYDRALGGRNAPTQRRVQPYAQPENAVRTLAARD